MELHEYHALEKVERDHWFYRGKREIVRWWIDRTNLLREGDRILDAGAGTGELVAELKQVYGERGVAVEGVEYVQAAREIAQRFRNTELKAGSILALPYADGTVRVSMALDVLEHVEDDARAWSELLRVTQQGGLVIVNVPSFMQLWSEWDVQLGHVRRYTLPEFKRLIAPTRGQFDVLYLGYVNIVGFLGIYAMRRLLKNRPGKRRAEDVVPPSPINALLRAAFVGPVRIGLKMPFGSSVLCVVRKK